MSDLSSASPAAADSWEVADLRYLRRGQPLRKYDHFTVWTRPQRPVWMDKGTYAEIPEQLVLRELHFQIIEHGRRTKTINVITTLVDADEFTKEQIAELYGFRWNSETVNLMLTRLSGEVVNARTY